VKGGSTKSAGHLVRAAEPWLVHRTVRELDRLQQSGACLVPSRRCELLGIAGKVDKPAGLALELDVVRGGAVGEEGGAAEKILLAQVAVGILLVFQVCGLMTRSLTDTEASAS